MRMFDILGGVGRGLIQAGQPRPAGYPAIDPISAISMGLASGAQAGSSGEDRYLKRAMVGAQIAKVQAELKRQKDWADLLSGGGANDPATNPAAAPAATPAPATTPPATPAPDQQAFIQTMMPHALQVSQATGLDPRLVLAQSALETGYGQHAPGNNYFGIKADGGVPNAQTLATTEVGANGPYQTQAAFRTYPDAGASAQDYAAFIKGNPRYQPVLAAQGLDAQINAMGQSGYATDPNYAAKLRQIAQGLPSLGGAAPTISPQVAQGDVTGGVTPVQYTPQQAQAPAAAPVYRPQTMREVIQSMPPGVRKIVGAMPPDKGIAEVLKYADPGSEAVVDTQTNQVIFIPKTMVGRDPRYAPVKGAELDIQRGQLANAQRGTDIRERNAEVTLGPGGQPVVNTPLIEARKAVSAAQGTDVEAYGRKQLIDQTVKEHGTLQSAALQARTGMSQLDRLNGLLGQVSTGKFQGTMTDVKAMAKTFGVNFDALGLADDVGPAQAAIALANQFALQLRNPAQGAGMPGNLSNKDMEILQSMVPSINMTPEGIKLLTDTMRKMYQRSLDTADIANKWMRSGKLSSDPAGMYTELQKYAEEHPLFSESDLPRPAAPPPGATGVVPPPPPGTTIRGAPPARGNLPPLPPGTRLLP